MTIEVLDINNAESGFQNVRVLLKQLETASEKVHTESTITVAGFLRGYLIRNNEELQACALLYGTQLHSDGRPVLFFGHFGACSFESGEALLKALLDDVRMHFPGHRLIGPVNGSTWGSYRLPDQNEERLFYGDVGGKPFYRDLLFKCGFYVFSRYHTHIQTLTEPYQTNRVFPYALRYLNKHEISEKLEDIYRITMDAFSGAPLFQPLSFELFSTKYLAELEKLDVGYMPFAFNAAGDMVAYLLAYPAYDSETLVVKTIARKSGRAYAGAGLALSDEIIRKAASAGFRRLLHAFMHSANVSNSLSIKQNGMPFRSYSLFAIDLL